MIDRVLEHAWQRTVVLGRDERQAPSRRDVGLQPRDGRAGARVIILVAERQVADPHLVERERRRRQFRHGLSQLAIERIAAKAADHDGNLVVAYSGFLWQSMRCSLI